MNHKLFPILFLALAAALSCSTENEGSFDQINLEESLSFQGPGGSHTLELYTNGAWEARSSDKWCKVFPSGGSGHIVQKQEITVICDPNDGKADRVCYITVHTPNQSALVQVVQETEKGFYLPDKEIHTTTAAKTLQLEYWFNEPVSVELAKDCEPWLEMVPSSRDMFTDQLTLSVSENYSAKRTGTIMFKSQSKIDRITVIQDADDIPITDGSFRYWCNEFDLDNDGCISRDEASAARRLFLFTSYIRSLSGIEYFTGLEDIRFYFDSNNYIKDVSFRALKRLQTVFIDSGWFYDADFTENKMLTSLSLIQCKFTTVLNASGLNSLSKIQVYSMPHGGINLKGCHALKDVDIQGCQWLQELDLSDAEELQTLNCLNNPLLWTVYLKNRPENLYYDPSVTSIIYVE